MTNTQNMPVWARILLGIQVTEDNHCQYAGEPSDRSALAPEGSLDLRSLTAKQYLMLLEEAIRREQPLRPILSYEVVQ